MTTLNWVGGVSVARVVVVLVLVADLLAGWRLLAPPKLSSLSSGSEALGVRFSQAMESDLGLDAVAVVEFFPDRMVQWYAGREIDGSPVDEQTFFEIGSLQKSLTGMRAFSMVDSGALESTTTLQELAGEPEVGSDTLTVERLASHRSGLPLGQSKLRMWFAGLVGVGWPGGEAPGEVIDQALRDDTQPNPGFSYSNLGYAALGNGLALSTGTSYEEMMDGWIPGDLGIEQHIASRPDALPSRRTNEHSTIFAPARALFSVGYEPAGVSMWLSGVGLSAIGQAVMKGTFPGAGATAPVAEIGKGRSVGYGWFRRTHTDSDIVWNSGGTAGARSFLGYNEGEQRGVAILSNSASRDIGRAGLLMLGADPDSIPPPTILIPVSVYFTILLVLALLSFDRSGRSALGFLAVGLLALLLLLVLRGQVAGGRLPEVSWYFAVAAFTVTVIRSAVPAVHSGQLVGDGWRVDMAVAVVASLLLGLYFAH